MSTDEPQSNGLDMNGDNHAAGAHDVTIKFSKSDVEIQGHKSALVAGSTFFSNHFQMHPSSTRFQAPKDIRPGETISLEVVQAAINYLHGEDMTEKYIARNDIPLLLAARAFGITSLEEQIEKHLTDKLDHQVGLIATQIQIIELVDALRDLYGRLGGEGDVEIGREVAGIVTGAAAHACCRKFPVLRKSPEFMGLLKEVPVLAYDILASDVEVITGVEYGSVSVEGEDVKMGEEGSKDVVPKVVENVAEAIVEEVTVEVAEEVVRTVEE